MQILWIVGLWWVVAPWIGIGGVERAASEGTAQKRELPRPLEIQYIDVEGGAATLIITPAGESILIDAGWPGNDDRDAQRIQLALQEAGLQAIDHLIITHYHTDHYGGVPALAKRVKIHQVYDHGPMSELAEDRDFARKYAAYQEAIGGRSTTLRPGSSIRLKTLSGTPPVTLRCLAARGEVISESRMAGAPNRSCREATTQDPDPTDNARSLVLQLRYGNFDFLDTGDLTWNIEEKLVCPQNLIGEVDLFQVGHHGTHTSNNPVLLRSIQPTVAIMNNGPRKGGHPETIRQLQAIPLLADLYQVHRNVTIDPALNTSEELIANLEETPDTGSKIIVRVELQKREFSVTNQRTGGSRSYPLK
jgi:competence protein ComEC